MEPDDETGPKAGTDADTAADGDGGDEDGGSSRRAVLAALGAAGVLGVGGAAVLYDGSSEDVDDAGTAPGDTNAYDAFEAVRDAVRGSPDHRPARAATLVEEADPEAILAFVRDEITVDPPHPEEFRDTPRARRWGPRGTLRGGVGTPRDVADTLASLYTDAGFEAEVVAVRPRLTEAQVRALLFTPTDRPFEPALSEKAATTWRSVVGGEEPLTALDVDGTESAALAEDVLANVPFSELDLEPFTFAWDRFEKLPVVRVTVEGETRYANPFLPDATLDAPGFGTDPKTWKEEPDPYPTVRVSLAAATASAYDSPRELVVGEWSTADLAGRRVRVDTLPGIDPFERPDIRFSDIETFVPALTVSDPHADADTLTKHSVQGDAVTRNGTTLTVEDGVVHRDGRPLVDPATAADPSAVDTVEATVDAARYPNVRLGVTPRDADGTPVEGLSASAFGVEDEAPVGVSVAATSSAPRVALLVDRSGSMPAAYAGEAMDGLVTRLREAITTAHKGARIDQTYTDSNIYTNLAQAAESDANLLVYATDGDVGDELTPAFEAAFRAGPPALMLNVDWDHSDPAREMAALSGGIYAKVASHDEAVATVTDFVDATAADIPSYLLDYRTPTESTPGEDRTATVSVPDADATTEVRYTVPEAAVRPDEFASLQLTVAIGGRSVTRTLAGRDPVRDADRGVTDADLNAVAGAFFGQHVLSFEAAGASESVWLDDVLTSKLSTRSVYEAARDGDAEDVTNALREGVTVTPADLALLQAPLPDAVTEDSHTYQDTLRVVLHQQRPQFGTDRILRHTDALDLTRYRTVTEDPRRGFRLTAARTARVAVVEDALYEETAASVLDGRDLVRFYTVREAWEDADGDRAGAARVVETRASNEYAFVPDDDGPFAFWTVDADTGTVAGVLDDGSGGGYSQKRIKEQLKRLSRAIAVVNLLALAAGKAGLVSGPGGLALGAVAAYGQVLARLYGQVSLAIAIMDADHLDRAIGAAAIALACNLAKDLAMFRIGDELTPWIENVLGSVGGPSVC
jgi:hypothetical protein